MDKKALVFSGGGARGAYELGVWEALLELKMEFDIVVGTSIGSLNAALFVQGDFERAQELWYSVTPNTVVDIEEDDPKAAERYILLKAFAGGVSTAPLESLLKENISEEKIRTSKMEFGLAMVSFPNIFDVHYLRISDIEEGNFHKSLMASSTVFPAFRPVEINDKRYIDGGFQDNMPINLAIDMGAKDILAIDLKGIGRRKRIKKTDGVKIAIIESSRPLGSIFLFDQDNIKKNARLGYLDTLKHYKKLSGGQFYFDAKDYHKHLKPLKEEFLNVIQATFEEHENEFFDLFKVMSNLFLFKRASLDDEIDSLKLLLYAIDELGKLVELEDLEIYTLESFYAKVKTILDTRTEEDPKEIKLLRKNIIYIKNALIKDKINNRFYLNALRNSTAALVAFLVVAAEKLVLENKILKSKKLKTRKQK